MGPLGPWDEVEGGPRPMMPEISVPIKLAKSPAWTRLNGWLLTNEPPMSTRSVTHLPVALPVPYLLYPGTPMSLKVLDFVLSKVGCPLHSAQFLSNSRKSDEPESATTRNCCAGVLDD